MLFWRIFIATTVLGLSTLAHALELSQLALPISASVGIGAMKNSDLGLRSRTMNAFSLEVLPGYRFGENGRWLAGLHFDYRLQGQTTSIDSVNGSNFKGDGYLIGLGVRHNLSERFFVQGGFDFLGTYMFSKDTVSRVQDKLETPFGVRMKSGYAFFDKIPNLTFDADLQYLTYKDFAHGGMKTSDSTEQFMVSVGVTYLFESHSKEGN